MRSGVCGVCGASVVYRSRFGRSAWEHERGAPVPWHNPRPADADPAELGFGQKRPT